MSGFSADWLTLREPFDTAARAEADAVADFACGSPGLPPRQVVDLGCGIGANLRALAPRLGPSQRWLLVDHDPALLAALPGALLAGSRRGGYRVEGGVSGGTSGGTSGGMLGGTSGGVPGSVADGPAGGAPGGEAGALTLVGAGFDATGVPLRLDLAQGLAALPLPEAVLLTASALLDLVSACWLDDLITRAGRARATLLFTLSVDGRMAWDPTDPDDDLVQGAFAAHQRRDKGFGPALGPAAAGWCQARLSAAGWRTLAARSDWRIDGARSPAMLQALIDGTATAAIEQAPGLRDAVLAWQRRRMAGRVRTRLVVGHVDLGARPPA